MLSHIRFTSKFCCVLIGLIAVGLQTTVADLTRKSTLGTRFVVFGHLYPIVENDRYLNDYIDEINQQSPDLIFILGDSSLHKRKVVSKLKQGLQAEILFVAGNEEAQYQKEYLKNIGYLNKVVIRDDIQFILIDSSDSVDAIQEFIVNNRQDLSPEKHTVLLTHHRVWDDTLISESSYMHDKSYYFEELYPTLKDHIDTIFSGNSKRQYFSDLSNWENGQKLKTNWGGQNVNNIFWVDKVGPINCYSVGMGDGFPKASFVLAEVVGTELMVMPHYVATAGFDLLPRSLIQHLPGSFAGDKKLSSKELSNNKGAEIDENTQSRTLLSKFHYIVTVVLWHRYFLLGFGIALVLSFVVFLLLYQLHSTHKQNTRAKS